MGYHQVKQHTYFGSSRRKRERERLFEEIVAENFPSFMKYMDTGIQEAQPTPSLINSKRPTLGHIVIKLLRAKEKEGISKEAREK